MKPQSNSNPMLVPVEQQQVACFTNVTSIQRANNQSSSGSRKNGLTFVRKENVAIASQHWSSSAYRSSKGVWHFCRLVYAREWSCSGPTQGSRHTVITCVPHTCDCSTYQRIAHSSSCACLAVSRLGLSCNTQCQQYGVHVVGPLSWHTSPSQQTASIIRGGGDHAGYRHTRRAALPTYTSGRCAVCITAPGVYLQRSQDQSCSCSFITQTLIHVP